MKATPLNIVRIPNFLSDKEIEYFVNHSRSLDILNDPNVTSRAMLRIDGDKDATDEMRDYIAKVQEAVTFHCGMQITDLCGIALRKWLPGELQDPHADCEAVFVEDYTNWQMTPLNNFSSLFIEYAALVYLNDDYEGGEIYFPEYDVEIKPNKGDLIFFPGTHYYMHGVREVLSGHRLALMSFFTTPKLQYIWKYFVLDDTPIRFVDRTQDDAMAGVGLFSRSHIPLSLATFGDKLPSTLDVKVAHRELTSYSYTRSLFGTHRSNINIVHNFIDKDSVDALMCLAHTITEWNDCGKNVYDDAGVLIHNAEDWRDKTCGADILTRTAPAEYAVMEIYALKAKLAAEKFFKCSLSYRKPALVRWRAGGHTPEPHADKQNIDGTPKLGMEDLDVSAVMYLNDDYEGGELVFPQHNMRFKPGRGSLIFFPGDDAYIHYVDHVKTGTRWAIPMFFTVEANKSELRNG
jgi:predicted 2-oxoglutarate/Fe(II)-dependent dioxygenase YbiX